MDFREFQNKIKNEIPEYLLDINIKSIDINKVNKNNGVYLTGLIILEQDSNVSPTIYLDSHYNKYQSGEVEFEDVIKDIASEYRQARGSNVIKSVTLELDFDDVIAKLVNYEKNKDMLANAPHKRINDLAVTYRNMISNDSNGIASYLITNDIANRYNISEEALDEKAIQNMKEKQGLIIKPLGEVLSGAFPDARDMDGGLYVMTNKNGINGATTLLYGKEELSALSEKLKSDLIILPSSIHEVLILPKDDAMDVNELKAMVEEINSFAVSEMDFLSDNIYMFDGKTKEIEQLTGLDRGNDLER
ncbi:MAG: DUF5688 family protein [Lachnospiraceae bacterium]|nr:DUF5688 family protein [Lachnospiraceae bacterium]